MKKVGPIQGLDPTKLTGLLMCRKRTQQAILFISLFVLQALTLQSQELNFRFVGTELNCDTKVMCFDIEAYANEPDVLLDEINVRFFIDDAQMTLMSIHNPPTGYYLEFGNNSTTGVAGAGQSFFGFQGEFLYVKDNLKRTGAEGLEIGVGPQNYTYLMEACFQIVADVDLNALNSFCPTIVWDKEENGQSGFGTGSEGLQALAIDPDDPDQSISLVEYVDHYNWDYFNPIEESCFAGVDLVCIGDQEQTLNEDCEVIVEDYTALFNVIFDDSNSEVVFTDCSYDSGVAITQSPPSGSIITETTIITVTGTDVHGNTEICEFELEVMDNSNAGFTIDCPIDQSVSADENCLAILPDYTTDAIVMDNCTDPQDIIVTQSPTIGSTISGTINVTLTATDLAGNQVTCDFDVTVVDDSTNGFTITCPANQNLSANENCEATLPDYTSDATVIDNCSDPQDILVTQSPLPGSTVFGITTITLTATDEAGNQVTCDFDVTVVDDSTNGFAIICPDDQSLSANEDCQASLPDYTDDAIVIDNCSDPLNIVITQIPAPGSIVAGTTIVTLTATDEVGNQVTCEFNAKVNDDSTIGFTINCPNNQSLSANENCEAVLPDYTDDAIVMDNCSDPQDIVVTQNPIAGSIVSGNTTITLTATDEAGNQVTCDFDVTVEDDSSSGFTITCPEDQSLSADVNCEAILPDYTDDAIVVDNCSDPQDILVTQSPLPGITLTGTTIVILTATDEAGNQVICEFDVTVIDDSTNGFTITCPDDQNLSADENCEASLPDYTNDAIVTDNCSAPQDIVVTQNPNPGTMVVGTSIVTLTATDEAGNQVICQFNVMVEDDSSNGFSIVCPENQSLSADENCEAILPDYTDDAIVVDNCSDPQNIVVTQSPLPGITVAGITSVTLIATDEAGNQVNCEFNVTVVDDSTNGFTITCPDDQNLSANTDCEASLPDYTADATVFDNCSDPQDIIVTQSPIAGTMISGTNSVTLTATDEAGNQVTCTFNVTVEDDSTNGFTIICPEDQILNANANCDVALPDFTDNAIVSDNCSDPQNIVVTQSPVPGTIITASTDVTLTATDEGGNQVSCTFNVGFNGNVGLSLTCPPDQTLSANEICIGIIPDFTNDITVDLACSNAPIVQVLQNPGPNSLFIGTTTIWITVIDADGTSVTCNFDVTLVDDTTTGLEIECPNNQLISADNNCEAILPNYTGDVDVSDNCSAPDDIIVTQSPLPGTIITGVTIITMTATDEAGNSVSCDFEITVDDDNNNGLVIDCPTIQDVDANDDCEAVLLDYSSFVTVMDNCSDPDDIIISQLPSPGTVITQTTTVTLTATDESGNEVSCDFDVNVVDNEEPVLTCPSEQFVIANVDCEAIVPDVLSLVTVEDNCSNEFELTMSQDPVAGSVITASTTIVVTAIDQAGNPSICNIPLTIEYCEALVCGNIYHDINGNGTQDQGEPDLPLVDVVITDSYGNIQTVSTQVDPDGDLNGVWCAFVAPGDITIDIDETDPNFLIGSTQTEGEDPTVVTVISGQFNDGGTDGFTIEGEVCGHLYLDENGNGMQDLGEDDLPNVDVIITDVNNNVQTISSDENGDYCAFVPQGVVQLDIDENDPDYPTGSVQTEGDDPTLAFAISSQTVDGGNDGFSFYGEICGHVYNDLNGNGTQDPGEPGLSNVDVIITDSNGNLYTAVTILNPANPSEDGDWCIFVPPGNVTVNIDENDPDFLTGSMQTEGENPSFVTAVVGQTVDAGNDGYQLLGNLCGHLYLDENGNGMQDIGETDLQNIDVVVEDFSGNIQTVSSDANGNYCANVAPGTAIVDVDETDPDFPQNATQTEGTDPSSVFAISGQTVDAGNDGYSIYGELCGHIYHDVNGNGMQDAGEPDLPLVDVIITDGNGTTYTVTTQLDPDGDLNGVWCVSVPPGEVTIDIDETDPEFIDDATQTEGDDPTVVTVIGGQFNDGGEDGYSVFGELCGHIYLDTNGNGTQDLNEPNLPNIDVLITDVNNNHLTITSDHDGDYCVMVPPGAVKVDIDETDSDFPQDAIQTEGEDPSFVSAISGQTMDAGIDGYSIYGEVCGHVYFDTNGNGIQDAGEPDLSNIDVIITDVNGTTYTVTTQVDPDGDMNGVWCINLPPGASTADIDDNDLPDGNVVQTEGDDPTTFVVVAAQSVDGGEDGYSNFGELCGHVYFDANNNSTQDAGDYNLVNVEVIITDANGLQKTVHTDLDGDYCLLVPPGVVNVLVVESDANIPQGSVQTEGDNPTLLAVIADLVADAGNDGFTNIAEVCGHVYIDLDENGIEDPTDLNFANLDVIIEDGSGLSQTVTTDQHGNYCAFVSPGNVIIFPDETDPDLIPGSYLTDGFVPINITAEAGQTSDADDLGYFVPAALCGRVFYDENQNGVMDPGEPGIPDISVRIADESGVPFEVVTDADGYYCSIVQEGTVFILVLTEDPDFPIGAIQTVGMNPSFINATLGGYVDAGNDGYAIGSAVCGLVYYDDNGNGTQDADEQGISEVTVFITDAASNIHTVETDEFGGYCYNVIPGTTTINIDETDPQFPSNALQTDGSNPNTINAVANQIIAAGNDGYQVCLTVNTKVFIEGALTDAFGDLLYTDLMRTDLNDFRLLPGQTYNDPLFGLIYNPGGQPYSDTPWFYDGEEGDLFDSQGNPVFANANYDADAVDWVLVSLRTGEEKSSEICRAAALLKNDGEVLFVEDFDCCGHSEESFFLVIEHRNHLVVMTPDPIERVGGEVAFDFTQNDSYKGLFGVAIGQKQVTSTTGNEYYVMLAANGDQDGTNSGVTDINVNDKVVWQSSNNQTAIYLQADFNLSGDTNVNDKVIHDINNNQFSAVPYN